MSKAEMEASDVAVSAEAKALAKMQGMVAEDDDESSAADGAEAQPEHDEPEGDAAEKDEPESEESSEEDDQDEGSEEEAGKGKRLFNEEQQAIFDKRVGKEIQKRKEAEERAKELEAQVQSLSTKVSPEAVKAVESAGIAPEYLTKDEAQTLADYAEWRGVRDFCRAHRDGYTGKGGKDRDMTAAEIEAWREKAEDRLMELSPEARAIQKSKARIQAEDAALGRKIRLERAAAAGKKVVTGAKKPVATARPGAMAPSAPAKVGRGMNKERFLKGGGNEDAALAELSQLV